MKRMVSEVKFAKLGQELKELETRGDDELKNRWRSLYGTKPPQKIHRSLLVAAASPRLQPKELRALTTSVPPYLIQAANKPPTPPSPPAHPSPPSTASTPCISLWAGRAP